MEVAAAAAAAAAVRQYQSQTLFTHQNSFLCVSNESTAGTKQQHFTGRIHCHHHHHRYHCFSCCSIKK